MNLDDAVLISKKMRKEYKEDIFFQNKKKKVEYNVHKPYPTLNHSNLGQIPLCSFSISFHSYL